MILLNMLPKDERKVSMFDHKPEVKIGISVHIMEYDTSRADLVDYISPTKKSCHFELHVKRNVDVIEAFDETFQHAKELLKTALKEEKKE